MHAWQEIGFRPRGAGLGLAVSLPRFMKPVANKVLKASLRFDGSCFDYGSFNMKMRCESSASLNDSS